MEADIIFQLLFCCGNSLCLVHGQLLVPFIPRLAAVFELQRHEQCILVQPLFILLAELFILGEFCRLEASVGDFQHLIAVLVQQAVVHGFWVVSPFKRGELMVLQKSVTLQHFKVDEVGIARLYRKGLVGRIAVARRRKGQYLPALDLSGLQKIHELKCRPSHLTYAVFRRQAGYVHKYTAFPHIYSTPFSEYSKQKW